jgi:hypothetical protein
VAWREVIITAAVGTPPCEPLQRAARYVVRHAGIPSAAGVSHADSPFTLAAIGLAGMTVLLTETESFPLMPSSGAIHQPQGVGINPDPFLPPQASVWFWMIQWTVRVRYSGPVASGGFRASSIAIAIAIALALENAAATPKDHGGKFREERPKEGSHQ